VGQFISVVGTWMQNVAQSWLVYDLTHSAAWLGIVAGATAIPFLLTIWGGQIADRFSRRDILIWTQTLSMFLAFVMAILATNRWIPIQPWHIALLAALLSIVNAFNRPAQQAFITDMVDDRAALPNAIALNSFRFNTARFLGPALAGIALVKLGVAYCFALNGISFLAVIISLKMMRLTETPHNSERPNLWGGFRYIWQNHSALRVIILLGCGSLFAFSASTLYPVFAYLFHSGAKGYSNMMSCNGAGAAIGGFVVAVLGSGFSRIAGIYGGAILFCVSLLIISSTSHFYVVLGALVFAGFSMIFFQITANIKMQEDVPDDLRGRVMAIFTLIFGGFMPLGGLLAGFLAQRFGAVHTVEVNSSICIVAVLATYLWSLIERRETTSQE